MDTTTKLTTNELRPYADGRESKDHGVPGVLVPKSSARVNYEKGASVAPNCPNGIGADYNVHAAIPHNVVIMKEGREVNLVMSTRAIAIMNERNKCGPDGKPPATVISHETAVRLAEEEKMSGIPNGVPAAGIPQLSSEPAVSLAGGGVSPVEQATQPQRPKHKVRFHGDFGRLAASYSEVFVHDSTLVMIQYDRAGDFFEAPAGESHVTVEVGNQKFACLPAIQYPVRSQNAWHTVYLIDKDKGTELGYDA